MALLVVHRLTPSEQAAVSVPATVAPEVRKLAKIDMPVSRVRVYADQPKLKKQLALPDAVQARTQEQVVAAVTVASDPDNRKHTVTTTVDAETGEAQSYVRADPLPWVALESRGEASVAAGYKLRPQFGTLTPIARLQVQHDFLQSKRVHLGVVGTVDTDGDTFVGVRAAIRW